ncbi:MAG: hypothetical protein IT307_07355 [Chloroflexi bacterium]|nr:hypothetical protein [Chloroflexota bacterium]
MKHLLLRLTLMLAGLLFGLALTELALRIVPLPNLAVLSTFQAPPASAWKDPAWQDPPDRAFRRHRTIEHEHAADVDVTVRLAEYPGGSYRFRTNNLGLRRDEPTLDDKPAGVFRVLVLGDSQTDGYLENAASFSTLLEAWLRPRLEPLGLRPEVLNAGVAGYSPAQEYLWYDVHGAELKPDLVILGFYPGNDVLELLDPAKPNVDPSNGRVIRPRDDDAPAARPPDAFRLLTVGRYLVQAGPLAPLWQQFNLPGRTTEVGGYSTDVLSRVFKQCHGCYLQTLQQAAHAKRDPAAMEAAINRAAAILVRLNHDVLGQGGKLVVALLATRAQVEPDGARPDLSAVGTMLGLSEADMRFDDIVLERVETTLSQQDVPVLPLRRALTEAARSGQLYYSKDWHLNIAGHRAVADALADGLARLSVLPTAR